MASAPASTASVPGERRCRRRVAAPPPEGALRPTDVIGGFFIAGLAMITAGVLAAVVNGIDAWTWGRWLALHLIFVGGISQLVLGASQFFAGAFLATDPPSRTLIRGQLLGWNVGTVVLAVAVSTGSDPGIYFATACLLATLVGYAAGLADMRRRSLGSAPWASRWYLAAAGFLAVGVCAGAVLATGVAWSYGNLLGGHMALNVGGWFGAAIVGTLHTFFPSLTRSRLRFPRLQLPTFGGWSLGVTALALGYGFSLDGLAVAGWWLLAAAAAMLAANIGGSLIAAPRPLSLPARVVAAAQLFLILGLVVAGVEALGSGAPQALVGSSRAAVGTLLVAGWIGLTVVGSLLHLLALLIRVRDLRRGMPAPAPLRDSAVTALAVLGVAAVALEQLAGVAALEQPTPWLLAAAYVLLGGRVAFLAGKVLATARPRV